MALRNFTEIVPFPSNTYKDYEIQAQLVERGRRLIDNFEREKEKHQKLFWSSVTYKRLEPGADELWELTASSLYAYDDFQYCKIGDLFYTNTREAKMMWSRGDMLRIVTVPPLQHDRIALLGPASALPVGSEKTLFFKPYIIAYEAYDTPPTYIENFWVLAEVNQ